MRYDCPNCGGSITRRRARKARRRLDAGRSTPGSKSRGRPILYTVFTVPPHLRPPFADRAAWRKLCRLAWSILRDAFSGEFGVESSHPVGDPSEGGDPGLFHPHANFLWIQAPGASPYLDVTRLRRLWCVALSRATGSLVHQADVWSHYYKAQGDLSLRIGYVMRTFPGCSSWTGSVRWFGHYPKIAPLVNVCPTCGQVFLYFGHADEADYQEYKKRRATETTHGP